MHARAFVVIGALAASLACRASSPARLPAAPAPVLRAPIVCAVDLAEWHRRTNTTRSEVLLCTEENLARICGLTSCSLLTATPCSVNDPYPSGVSSTGAARFGPLDFTIRTVDGLAVVDGGNVRGVLRARSLSDPSVEIALPLPSRPEGLITNSYLFAQRTLIVISTDHGSVVVSVDSLATPPQLVVECGGRAIIRQDLGAAECLSASEEEAGVWSRDHLGSFTIELREPAGSRGSLVAIDRAGHAFPIALPAAAFPGKGIEATWSADALERGGGRLFVLGTAGWLSAPVVRYDTAVFELVLPKDGKCPASAPRCIDCDPGYQSVPPVMNWSTDVEDLP